MHEDPLPHLPALLYTHDLAELLHRSVHTARRRMEELGAGKIGGRWAILKADLIKAIREGRLSLDSR